MVFMPIISGFGLIDLGLLFLFVFLGSLGAPTGFIAVISSGAIAGTVGRLLILISVSALAAITGDILAYEIARRFSFLDKKLQKYKFYSKGEPKARHLLSKYVFSSVFLTRFLFISLGAITSYICGFEKINRKKYILGVVTGEILFAIIFTTFGFIFRLVWDDLIKALNYLMAGLTVVAIVIVILIIRHHRNKKKDGNGGS